MTIGATIKAYRSKELTLEEAREALRAVKVVTPERHGGEPWINDFDDGIEGTWNELTAAAITNDLTPQEYEAFRSSLAAPPVGNGERASRDPHVKSTDEEAPPLEELLRGHPDDPAFDPDMVVVAPAAYDYEGTDPPPIGFKKHHGPGPHPSGSPQTVHGTGGGGGESTTDEPSAAGPPQTAAPSAPSGTRGGTRAERPKMLADLIGQDEVRDRLGIMARSAKGQGHPLDHLLFGGPPGLGKTTFANAMANEMGVPIRTTSGPAIKTIDDMAKLFTGLQPGEIVFIDEIHAMPDQFQELLYPAMEDFVIDLPAPKLPAAKPPGGDSAFDNLFPELAPQEDSGTTRVELPPFTLIGATTAPSSLAKPLQDRFGSTEMLDYYSPDALAEVATRTAGSLGMDLSHEAAHAIGERGRGTPRLINWMMRRVKDVAYDMGATTITPEIASTSLQKWGIDSRGLEREDRSVLSALAGSGGAPLGLTHLSARTGISEAVIHQAIEPYLIRLDFITYTPQGRTITPSGLAHLEAEAELVNKRSPFFEADFKVAKFDTRKNVVLGWANVAFTKNGQVEDRQGHLIDVEELEDTAYNFVLKYRVSGEMHSGESFGELVESLVVTQDKIEKAGFPQDMLGHWWVGFKLPPDRFQKVLDGKLAMFSIQGKARLEELV